MSTNKQLDPYVAQAEDGASSESLQQKISAVKSILKTVDTGMLTTHATDGTLHSRAMNPAAPEDNDQLNLIFFANNVSAKFDDLKIDSSVNVSFYDQATTNWASFSGVANVSNDINLIRRYWSDKIAKYYGDLGDGVHKGDENDPRVSLIEVRPIEIRYWVTGQSSGSAAPGSLRTITQQELAQHGGYAGMTPASQHFANIVQGTYRDQIPGLDSLQAGGAGGVGLGGSTSELIGNVIGQTYDSQRFGGAPVSDGSNVRGHLDGVLRDTYQTQQFGGNVKDARSAGTGGQVGPGSTSEHFSNVMNQTYGGNAQL